MAKKDKDVEKVTKKSAIKDTTVASYGKGLSAPSSIPGFNIDATLDAIEKKIGVTSSGMNSNEKRMSTGMLMYDIVLGGGLTDGWYTNFGKEQSCKSTGAMTLLSSGLMNNVPILSYFDYEGCVIAASKINTPKGEILLETLIKDTPKTVGFHAIPPVTVLTQNGKTEINRVYYKGIFETVKITTSEDKSLTGLHHKIRVVEGLQIKWKNIEDLLPGDAILTMK
jgi:hypothetical protein